MPFPPHNRVYNKTAVTTTVKFEHTEGSVPGCCGSSEGHRQLVLVGGIGFGEGKLTHRSGPHYHIKSRFIFIWIY